MKKVKVYIEKGADDYSAYMDDTPLDYSCIGQGATVEEAIEDFRACYNEMRNHYKENDKSFEEVNLEFYYDIPSFLQDYAYATVRKIEDGIHRFSQQLSAVRFV